MPTRLRHQHRLQLSLRLSLRLWLRRLHLLLTAKLYGVRLHRWQLGMAASPAQANQ